MLGQPISMLIPEVLGVRLKGKLPEGATATDLVLTVTERLRKQGVVGKFVEFFGPGMASLTVADRATLGNMAPEYGATIAIFPIDAMTLDYLRLTGRPAADIALVEAYTKAQGLFRTDQTPEATYATVIDVDLGAIVPCLAGPRRPQDRVTLKDAKSKFATASTEMQAALKKGAAKPAAAATAVATALPEWADQVDHGAVVVAAITSCTNTSNPSVMIGAGLLAKKAVERGLTSKPWVKTSLAPGSQVVTAYLQKAGLMTPLEALGFDLVGYGCTTCIGNSGPLPDEVVGDHRGEEPHRRLGAERQPQLRRPHPAAGARQLPGVAAAGRRLRAGRQDDGRPHDRAARHRQGRQEGVPQGHLAERGRDPGVDAGGGGQRPVHREVRRRLQGRRSLARAADAGRRALRLDRRLDLHPQGAVLRQPHGGAGAADRHHGGARARRARRQRHHRPHLAGRIDQEGQPGGAVPDRQRRRAVRLQLLRRAARQPRGDGARHLRQHPAQEPARARDRRRRHAAPAGRRADVDLRRRDAVPGARARRS